MICTPTISSDEACILAIETLDDLVNELMRVGIFRRQTVFLDWIANVATPLVEQSVLRSYANPRFVESLQMGEPKIALAHWVRHWVGPRIAANFDELAARLPEFASGARSKEISSSAR